MKYCTKCNKTKKDEEFFIRKRNNRPYGYCKKCVSKYTVEKLTQYKKELVEYMGGGCQVCGYSKCIRALSLHHLDPKTKIKNYKALKNWSFERKKIEADKCILLCLNCHMEVESGITLL